MQHFLELSFINPWQDTNTQGPYQCSEDLPFQLPELALNSGFHSQQTDENVALKLDEALAQQSSIQARLIENFEFNKTVSNESVSQIYKVLANALSRYVEGPSVIIISD